MAFYKNKAGQRLAVYAEDASGDPKTGDAANITARLSRYDASTGAAEAAVADTNPTEISASNHAGWYEFDISQAESNADRLILTASSVTSGVKISRVIVYTEPEVRQSDVVRWLTVALTDPLSTLAEFWGFGDASAAVDRRLSSGGNTDVASAVGTAQDPLLHATDYYQSGTLGYIIQTYLDARLSDLATTAALAAVAANITSIKATAEAGAVQTLGGSAQTTITACVLSALGAPISEHTSFPGTLNVLTILMLLCMDKFNPDSYVKATGRRTINTRAGTPAIDQDYTDDGTTTGQTAAATHS